LLHGTHAADMSDEQTDEGGHRSRRRIG